MGVFYTLSRLRGRAGVTAFTLAHIWRRTRSHTDLPLATAEGALIVGRFGQIKQRLRSVQQQRLLYRIGFFQGCRRRM